MESIDLLVQFNGIWNSNSHYEDYDMDGIVVDSNCNYSTLVTSIMKMLQGFGLYGSIDIKYKLNNSLKPMVIYNDMSLKFYFDLRRRTSDITQFPLCVTIHKESGAIETGAIVCADNETENHLYAMSQGELQMNSMTMAKSYNMLNSNEGNEYEQTCLDNIMIITDAMHNDICEGQLYRDKKTLICVMKNVSLRQNFKFRVDRSSATRYALLCAGKECGWIMRSSSIGGSGIFKIREYNGTHTCPEEERILSERHASYATIGEIIKDKFTDPKRVYTPNNIIQDIKKDYGLTLNYMKAWRSKERALELLRGNPSKSYNILPSYLYMVRSSNPGSVTKLHKTSNNHFKYVYISLNASIQSWKYCRPVVVVDGCFISDVHGGTLIAASTQDGEGSIVPLAYAVVDSENDKSWEWFFKSFRETYGSRLGMCIVSDRCASISRACSTIYPELPHCICVYHLWNNIKTNFKIGHQEIGEIFFTLAKAYTLEEFAHYMNEIERIDKRVKKYLCDIGYHKWSRAYSEANRGDMMTSNIAESINGRNKHARSLPIIELLDAMKDMVRKWNWENKKKAMGTFKILSNKNQSIFKNNMDASRRMKVIPSNEFLYEVQDNGTKHVVCLRYKTCTCRRFQLDEIPCPHAQAVLKYNNLDAYKYCSQLCTKENLVQTYNTAVLPMQDQKAWTVPEDILFDEVLPPKGRSRAGRPKKRRIKAGWEVKCKLACSRCGMQGHNRKTCRNPPMLT